MRTIGFGFYRDSYPYTNINRFSYIKAISVCITLTFPLLPTLYSTNFLHNLSRIIANLCEALGKGRGFVSLSIGEERKAGMKSGAQDRKQI